MESTVEETGVVRNGELWSVPEGHGLMWCC